MIYIKTKLDSGIEMRIEVYGDEFYCVCPKCGKEIQLDEEALQHLAPSFDFAGTSYYCKDCSKEG